MEPPNTPTAFRTLPLIGTGIQWMSQLIVEVTDVVKGLS